MIELVDELEGGAVDGAVDDAVGDAMGEVEIPRGSEARLRRALRQMRRSGRRLVRWQEGWRVMHGGGVVAELTVEEGAFLMAEHHVVDAAGGGMVLAAAQVVEADAAPDVAPVSGAWVFEAAGKHIAKGTGRGFDRLARRASEGEGPLTLRHIAAGLRLIADAESAARLPGMTMDWSGMPAEKRKGRGGGGAVSPSARDATRRVEKIRAALGDEAFDVLWALCILRRPMPKLAAQLGVPTRQLTRRLPEMFDVMAAVYDG
ncbi:MAG TPA: DUF6456 domain-containing protein [Hyphomonadaceae bacterium]|jgi:hypothetical protein|nr:DUF6456 domain-containing protein [Hyphomonadaceae bacterium]